MNLVFAILIFSIIIFIHELGHFLIAKANGIKVLEFSLGMGPRLFSFVSRETRYSLKILPIGGSCMMLGEDGPESNQEEGSYASKSVYARFSTIFAGPFFNFIYAFFLSIILIGINGYDIPVVSQVLQNGTADIAGLKDGDIIIAYNGSKITFYRDLSFINYLNPLHTTNKVELYVIRNNKKLNFTLIPEKDTRYLLGFDYTQNNSNLIEITNIIENSPLKKTNIQVGDIITSINNVQLTSIDDLTRYLKQHPLQGDNISLTYNHNNKSKKVLVKPKLFQYYSYGFSYNADIIEAKGINTLKYSFYEVSYWIKMGLKSITYLIRGKVGVDQMTGPVGIVKNIGEAVNDNADSGIGAVTSILLSWSILLSSNLGLMNLLPLPALDGGRLMFILIEAIRSKRINPEKEAYIHATGFILLMLLMIFVFFNDIKALF